MALLKKSSRKENSMRIESKAKALHEFLSAPSAGEGINDAVVTAVMGSKGARAVDRGGTFDPVKLKYHRPVKTFEDAFYACVRPVRGKRQGTGTVLSWENFDLETLQDCGFPELRLPTRIEDALERKAMQEEHESGQEAAEHADWLRFAHDEPEAVPYELLRRNGHRKKGGRRKIARSRRALASVYRQAKREYHRAGKALRCSHEKC